MLKIVTVVGARPQFIKAAVGSRQLRKSHTEILVHTGQHHDTNMSDVFFEQMDIPRPEYNLAISGGTHAQMTGRMMIALEDIFVKEKPDSVLLYGDTNSTMAAALAAVKQHIPVLHVEAGNRFGTLDSPEEVNRIVTDHVSALRFACVKSAFESLEKENLLEGSYLVGDPMYDAFLYYAKKAQNTPIIDAIDFDGKSIRIPEDYYYMTCHRQENTDNLEALRDILDAMESLDAPTIYPVHPRNHARVAELIKAHGYRQIMFIQPIGYLSSIHLLNCAKKVVTDSGGVQREAFFAGKQCVTMLDFVVWRETMVGNRNQLSAPRKEDILNKLAAEQEIDLSYKPFGDGHAVDAFCEIINQWEGQTK